MEIAMRRVKVLWVLGIVECGSWSLLDDYAMLVLFRLYNTLGESSAAAIVCVVVASGSSMEGGLAFLAKDCQNLV
ncbi:hypothetical protein Tco_0820223 [Tanacetum coccineum]|uniref:Uncharacterized protein n=1 Tax=Tanacetum coccineum TaxID=301880 RepID=A0ABQ5AD21_9ASTR